MAERLWQKHIHKNNIVFTLCSMMMLWISEKTFTELFYSGAQVVMAKKLCCFQEGKLFVIGLVVLKILSFFDQEVELHSRD